MKKYIALLISFCIIFFAGCQNEAVTNSGTNVSDTKYNSAPYIISVVLDELKDIRNAVNSMQEEPFKEYMYEKHYGAIVNGMNTIENAKNLMEEFEATTIPVLDGDSENVSKLLLYRESNCIHNLIIYDSEEIQRTSVWVYTVNSEKSEVLEFGEEVEIVSINTVETDRYTANLYETRNADYKFYGEAAIDGSYIVLRSFGIETIEEFEECFSRLEFRKIGDLLDEIPEETTENALSENEQTAVTENVYVVETTLYEQTDNIETETQSTEFVSIPEGTTLPEQTEALTTE